MGCDMGTMEPERLLSQIVGLPLWKLIVSPAGMTMDFGGEHDLGKGYSCGEFCIWVECRLRLVIARKEVFGTGFPLEREGDEIRSLIQNLAITRTGIDDRDNSLRLMLSEKVLLSAYPGTRASECGWRFQDWRTEPHSWFAVYSDALVSGKGTQVLSCLEPKEKAS